VPSTSSHATAQSAGISASARIRRLPSSHFETGSCAITITSVFTKKTAPIARSVTCDWSFANCASSPNIE